MALRVLATGDIHIGRRPTRVSEPELAERASAARMWETISSRAIDLRVDAVLLSGDIVDHDNRFYEATGPLERGIIKLAEADIPTYAVAGNHDWDVFPRILNQLNTPLLRLLGQRGGWEETHLERDGEPLLRIVGWSFPARQVRQNPLKDFPLISDSRLPTIGLLHADVDVPDSDYAPVRLVELQTRNIALWILGHIHKPQHWRSETGAHVLYPGSPQAFDPGETGAHGPWVIEFDGPRLVDCRQLPISLVRYEEHDVDLSAADSDVDFETQINEAVIRALEGVANDDDPPELLLLRLRLLGATPLCGRIEFLAQRLGDLERRTLNGVRAQIDKYDNLTRPAIDIEEFSRRSDPAGMLARTLIALESGYEHEALSALVRDATSRLQEVHRASAYAALGGPPPDCGTARQLLLQQGRQLMETLRNQRPETEEEPA